MNSLHRAIALPLVILSAGVVGFLAYRWFAKRVEAPPPPVMSPAVSRTLPDLNLPDLTGKSRSLSEWKGKPLIVNFWATWCEPCRREIPLLTKLRAEYAAEELEIIGIAIDFRDDVAAYALEAKIEYPILVAEGSANIPQALGVGGALPTSLFVQRDGRIAAVKTGELQEEAAAELLARTLEVW